jgi:hypothetical protein
MTMDPRDRVLADLLRENQPSDVDPAFRFAVLERLARQVFRRQLIATLLGALASGVVLTIAMQASASSTEIGSLLVVGAGLVVSWRFYAPVLAHWTRVALRTSKES